MTRLSKNSSKELAVEKTPFANKMVLLTTSCSSRRTGGQLSMMILIGASLEGARCTSGYCANPPGASIATILVIVEK